MTHCCNQFTLHTDHSFMLCFIFPQQRTGITPLSVACVMGDLTIVQSLVEAMNYKLSHGGKRSKKRVRQICMSV